MIDVRVLFKRVNRSYYVSLITVTCFLCLALSFFYYFIQQHKSLMTLVHAMDKQRMLLPVLTFNVQSLKDNWRNENKRQFLVGKITTFVDDMEQAERDILNNLASTSDDIQQQYLTVEPQIHQKIMVYVEQAKKVTELTEFSAIEQQVVKHFSLTTTEPFFIQLNQNFDQLLLTLEGKLKKLENVALFFALLTVIFFLSSAFYVFRNLSGVIKINYKLLRREKNQITDFKNAIDEHAVVFRVKPDQTINYVNERFCQLYGYSADEALNQHYHLLGSKQLAKRVYVDMARTLMRGDVWRKEVCNFDKQGRKHWLETTVVPIFHKRKVVNYMVIQNDVSEQRQIANALSRIHTITSLQQSSLSEKIEQLLALGNEMFYLPFAIVSEIKEQDYSVLYCRSPNHELIPGAHFDVANTYCVHTLNANKPTAFHHASNSYIKTHPCYINFQLESYIGCPIMVDGKPFGTLNFSSPDVHHQVFSETDFELIQLLAQWVGNEITRERQQASLVSQQQLMTQMSQQARIGAWEVDLVKNEIFWSEMTKEIHEVSADYIPDLTTAINFYKEGESRDTITRLVQESIEKGTSYQVELELITAKGNEIWVEAYGKAEFKNGQCVRLYGSFQDISEKKAAEFELQAQNQRMGVAADSAGIGIWEYNIKTGTLDWDESMFRLYGIEPKCFNGMFDDWQSSVFPDDREKLIKEFEFAISSSKKFNTQFRIVHPEGVRYLKASAIVSDETQTVVGVNYDITERIENEIAITKAKEEAELASNVKNEFLASMSHEIRTPMNGVVGMLELLAETRLNDDQLHKVNVAKSSANSLLFLINDILDYSKIDANKLQLEAISFDIKQLVSDVTDAMFKQVLEKNLELVVDTVNVVEPTVVGDPNRIRQIVTNLVSNAIKFTTQGEVVIRVELADIDDEKWQLTIVVQDSGIGVAKEDQAALFESFSQVDASTTRKFGGTGLGLAIVKRLSLLMAGDVSVESEIGEGCTFTCNVEVLKDTQSTNKTNYDRLANLSILVVDDNNVSLRVITQQLKKWQVKVTAVSSAQQVFDITKDIQPNFDLAIIDMNMPEVDGLALAKKLSVDKEFEQVPLVLMDSMNLSLNEEKLKEFGFLTHFSKPATCVDLYKSILCVLDQDKIIEEKVIDSQIQHNKIVSWSKDSRVLLVEDNRVNQMVAKGMLDKLGLKTIIAMNGQDALDKLNNEEMSYGLILMDCQMPIMDGYTATEKIRQGAAGDFYIDVPIIAMTANAMEGDREKCIAVGMNDYLAKPIEKDLIIEKLQLWLTKLPQEVTQ